MKDKLKDFFKPTISKLVLAFLFLAWQYFYSFTALKIDSLTQVFDYILKGLGLVNWNNYFVRTGSLIFIWLFVSVVIFIMIWGFERISIFLYNRKVEKKYINQPKEDYKDILKSKQIEFSKHFVHYSLWAGGVLFILMSLFVFSDLLENIRFNLLDTFLWNLQENGEEIDFNNLILLIISFVTLYPFWYIFSCVVNWLFKEGKMVEDEEEIFEEHSAVVIKDTSSDNEEDVT